MGALTSLLRIQVVDENLLFYDPTLFLQVFDPSVQLRLVLTLCSLSGLSIAFKVLVYSLLPWFLSACLVTVC